MLEFLGEAVISRAIDATIDSIKGRWGARESEFDPAAFSDPKVVLQSHIRMIHRWASEISFRDLGKAKRLHDSFVDLDIRLGHSKFSDVTLASDKLKVTDLVHLRRNFIILGDPGAGKTTALKRISLQFLAQMNTERRPLVLLVRLREFANSSSLARIILRTLGIDVDNEWEEDDGMKRAAEQRFALRHLEDAELVVLIDGLDETNPLLREKLVDDLRFFFLHANKCRFIVTCRLGDFRYHIEKAAVLTLQSLTAAQIEDFTHRWLGSERAPDFLKQINRTPYAGSEVRPLTLAHLCAIYERSGTIPDRPRTVYRKIVRLLIEEWDEQRSVQRYSKYANFEVDRKEDFLQAIAYRLTLLNVQGQFTHAQLETAYGSVYLSFGLPKVDAVRVVREIESHTGLIVESSFETYEFAHKSLQEYLTAAFALRMPYIPGELLDAHPDATALLVALASDPNAIFFRLLGNFVKGKLRVCFRLRSPLSTA